MILAFGFLVAVIVAMVIGGRLEERRNVREVLRVLSTVDGRWMTVHEVASEAAVPLSIEVTRQILFELECGGLLQCKWQSRALHWQLVKPEVRS